MLTLFSREFLLIFNILLCCSDLVNCEEHTRVAIVGGGIGGTTAAYRLRQMAVDHNIQLHIDLFEPDQVGGRLATASIQGFQFETGGSIIHSQNQYMNLFLNKFNLKKYQEPDKYTENDLTGLYNGQEFIFIQSRYNLINLFKLWWRYGWDLKRVSNQVVNPLLEKFQRIYALQNDSQTFDTVSDFLAKLDPEYPLLQEISIHDLLLGNNINKFVINEFAFISTNVNYNQNTYIHGFVGAVALAGSQDDLWSVQGGNKQVAEKLLEHSDAHFIKAKVETIMLTPDSKYALQADDSTHLYDYVIIACPIMENSFNNIEFEGFPNPVIPNLVKYQNTIVTLVHGELNYKYFNFESPHNLPNHIYSVDEHLFFNSISVLNPVTPCDNYDRKVFKVFSKKLLTESQLKSLFLIYDKVSVVDWLAYPLYDTQARNMPFVLHDKLFYVNAIEWAASAMEMSAVSGVNAALHVMKHIKTSQKLNN